MTGGCLALLAASHSCDVLGFVCYDHHGEGKTKKHSSAFWTFLWIVNDEKLLHLSLGRRVKS